MGFWQAYITSAGGVVLSIIIPVLARAVREQFYMGGPAELSGLRILARASWRVMRPYLLLGAFSLVVALLIIAVAGETLRTWESALIAGYLWDSTLQKFAGKP